MFQLWRVIKVIYSRRHFATWANQTLVDWLTTNKIQSNYSKSNLKKKNFIENIKSYIVATLMCRLWRGIEVNDSISSQVEGR